MKLLGGKKILTRYLIQKCIINVLINFLSYLDSVILINMKIYFYQKEFKHWQN